MRRYCQIALISVLLIASSVAIYAVQYRIFHDLRGTLFYLLQERYNRKLWI